MGSSRKACTCYRISCMMSQDRHKNKGYLGLYYCKSTWPSSSVWFTWTQGRAKPCCVGITNSVQNRKTVWVYHLLICTPFCLWNKVRWLKLPFCLTLLSCRNVIFLHSCLRSLFYTSSFWRVWCMSHLRSETLFFSSLQMGSAGGVNVEGWRGFVIRSDLILTWSARNA